MYSCLYLSLSINFLILFGLILIFFLLSGTFCVKKSYLFLNVLLKLVCKIILTKPDKVILKKKIGKETRKNGRKQEKEGGWKESIG